MKVVFCTPSLGGPTKPYIAALEQSIPLITAAGWQEGYAQEVANAYISGARATMLRKAINAGADVIVFLDYDVAWNPPDLLRLIQTPGDVVAGTYRYKEDEEKYMGFVSIDEAGQPTYRADGCIKADFVPAGFLKVTRQAINRFMLAYPDLVYGEPCLPHVDLFNHGAIEGIWFGEDYAFCLRWREIDGEIWIIPDLEIDHYARTPEGGDKPYKGNFGAWLQKQLVTA